MAGMSSKNSTAITLNVALDIFVAIIAIAITISVVFSKVSDAGLLLIYSLPLLILLSVDIIVLRSLRNRYPFFPLYYLITRLPILVVIFHLLVNSPPIILGGGLIGWAVLMWFTLKTNIQK